MEHDATHAEPQRTRHRRPARQPTGPHPDGGDGGGIMALQRQAGNRAVSVALAVDGPPVLREHATATVAEPVVWSAPADISPTGKPIPCRTGEDVARMLRIVAVDLEATGSALDEAGARALAGMAVQVRAEAARYAASPALKANDPGLLDGYLSLAHGLAHQQVQLAVARAVPLMDVPEDGAKALTVSLDDLTEKSHLAFIGGDKDALAEVIGLISKVQAVVDAVNGYADNAKKVSELLAGLKQVDRIGALAKKVTGLVGPIATQIGNAKKIVSVVHDVAVLKGVAGTGNGTAMMTSIAQFNAGIGLIDKTIGTFGKAVPLFGDLWSKVYKPMIDGCVKALGVIARFEERRGREFEILDLMVAQGDGTLRRDANGAPILSPAAVRGRYFPGGQAVFSYVYAVRKGGEPALTDEVRDYFLDRVDLFNVKEEKADELSGGDWHVLSPGTWSRSGRRHNVAGWVAGHIDKVWAMLYGDLGREIP
jgi:hypothetical protein